ncbi:MAG TPA: M23 family metallopeptidase [Mucilaginibacter sp.]
MSRKTPEISTVVIINKNQQASRSVQIKTKHLNRLKHYAAGIVSVVIVLVGSIIYLKSQNTQQEIERQNLLLQIARLKGSIPAQAAAPAPITAQSGNAQTYVQAIEGKLKTINDYLRRRGLKGFSTKGLGGDNNTEGKKLSDTEVYSLYNDYLNHLMGTIAFTPMGYPRISSFTSFFGYRSDPFDTGSAEFHPGIDFKGRKGDEVKCTASGKVVFAGWSNGYGNCIRIQHINNFETVYGHLSKIKVKVGQQVNLGDEIGLVGSTGHSTGAHLHYEVRKNGKPVNPIKFLTLNK